MSITLPLGLSRLPSCTHELHENNLLISPFALCSTLHSIFIYLSTTVHIIFQCSMQASFVGQKANVALYSCCSCYKVNHQECAAICIWLTKAICCRMILHCIKFEPRPSEKHLGRKEMGKKISNSDKVNFRSEDFYWVREDTWSRLHFFTPAKKTSPCNKKPQTHN